jgi:capsular exopolysaccharide synthesis family protein
MSIQSEIDAIGPETLGGVDTSLQEFCERTIEITPDADSRLVFLTEPNGLAVEQYKLLRRRLSVLSPNGGRLIVTSPSPADGKTLTSINLAYAFADAGFNTCLIDLDFRASNVANILCDKARVDGVAEILSGECDISHVIRKVGSRSLYLLSIKDQLPTSSHQLTSARFKPMLKDLKQRFDWVILDMAPAIPMSDVAEVIPHVEGSLLVVRSKKTSKKLVAPTLEILGQKLWGVVFNDAMIHGTNYYGYYGYGRKSADRNRR